MRGEAQSFFLSSCSPTICLWVFFFFSPLCSYYVLSVKLWDSLKAGPPLLHPVTRYAQNYRHRTTQPGPVYQDYLLRSSWRAVGYLHPPRHAATRGGLRLDLARSRFLQQAPACTPSVRFSFLNSRGAPEREKAVLDSRELLIL